MTTPSSRPMPSAYELDLALEVVKPECEATVEAALESDFWLWNSNPDGVPSRKETPS